MYAALVKFGRRAEGLVRQITSRVLLITRPVIEIVCYTGVVRRVLALKGFEFIFCVLLNYLK